MTLIDPELLALLVCPNCRSDLIEVEQGLLCAREGRVYPVRDGVPHLVSECAKKVRGKKGRAR